MALIWADSFSRYGTGAESVTAMRNGLYVTVDGAGSVEADPDPNAPIGSRAFNPDGVSTLRQLRFALPTPSAGTLGIAARFWFTNLAASNGRAAFIQFQDVDESRRLYIHNEANGAIAIVANGVEVANTVSPVITLNAWHHVEVFNDFTTGDGELYVNGVQELTWTGTGATGTIAMAAHANMLVSGTESNFFMRDYVIWDGTGSVNNSAFGTVIVGRLNPNADVTLGGWVPSTGSTGFDLLAKTAVNDTTFLSGDDAPPALMEFEFENLDPDVTSVRGIVSVARMRKVDGGDANVQTGLWVAGDDDLGADRPITSAFTYWYDVSELSPDTSAPWTPAEVDDLTGTVDRTL